GLRTVEGVNRLPLGDWSQPNEAFGAVVRATETLVGQGFNGPYTVLVGPLLYAQLNRMFGNSGLLALEQVQKLARGGVEQSPVVPGGVALVLQASPDTLDLAVGLDVVTGYLGPENLNHTCRVLESAVPRIKQPRAIVVLEGAGESQPQRGRRA
ncbi:MAG TPA: family 1 encapsulin nanocompartment shell protein, partial [Dehalococcoidia bacterium]|nr:family 1 encapsulin nanocompartment shell protein [Dehalococcoidia bacterium]